MKKHSDAVSNTDCDFLYHLMKEGIEEAFWDDLLTDPHLTLAALDYSILGSYLNSSYMKTDQSYLLDQLANSAFSYVTMWILSAQQSSLASSTLRV